MLPLLYLAAAFASEFQVQKALVDKRYIAVKTCANPEVREQQTRLKTIENLYKDMSTPTRLIGAIGFGGMVADKTDKAKLVLVNQIKNELLPLEHLVASNLLDPTYPALEDKEMKKLVKLLDDNADFRKAISSAIEDKLSYYKNIGLTHLKYLINLEEFPDFNEAFIKGRNFQVQKIKQEFNQYQLKIPQLIERLAKSENKPGQEKITKEIGNMQGFMSSIKSKLIQLNKIC
jgi:uncharacterized coiled-coil protein SlyX